MNKMSPGIFFLCVILGACGQAEVPTAAPFAPSLTEDNLVGKVRRVVTEPLVLGGKATTEGSFLFIEGYSPAGYSIKVGYAKKIGNDIVEQSAFERTLEKNGRLVQTKTDDKMVNYRYETVEGIVRAVPVDASGKTMEAETHYEQKLVDDLVSITESTRDDGIASVRTYAKTGELLKRAQFDSYSGSRDETQYLAGKIVSEQSTKTDADHNAKVIVSKYVYAEGHLPQRILRYEKDTLVATEEYEYKVDAAGNWTEYSMYLTEPGKARVLSARERRVIEYYP